MKTWVDPMLWVHPFPLRPDGMGELEYRDFRYREMTHLSDDKTFAKMGHPVVVVRSDVGHPPLILPAESAFDAKVSCCYIS
jgi:hypothetical protein